MAESLSAPETQQEWASRGLLMKVGTPGPTLELHFEALRDFDGQVYKTVYDIRAVDRELQPSAYAARVTSATMAGLDSLKTVLEARLDFFRNLVSIYRTRQNEAAASRVPSSSLDKAAWETRVAECRRQLEKLEPGLRFKAAWDAVSKGRADILEAIQGSLVPLLEDDAQARIEKQYLDNASPEATAQRGTAESMLSEMERMVALVPGAFKIQLAKQTSDVGPLGPGQRAGMTR